MGAVQDLVALFDLASNGCEYSRFDVWPKVTGDGADVVGRGHDFQLVIPVPDVVDGQWTDSSTLLRILALSKAASTDIVTPSLLISVGLAWTTSEGDEHVSFAEYILGEGDVAYLDLEDRPIWELSEDFARLGYEQFDRMTDEELERTEAEAVAKLRERFERAWNRGVKIRQIIPGLPESYGTAGDEADFFVRPSESAAMAYHSKVIAVVKGVSPMMCALSDAESSAANPEELRSILSQLRCWLMSLAR